MDAIESRGPSQETCFEFLAAKLGGNLADHRETRKESWQLIGRSTADAPVQTVLISSPRITVGRHPDNDLCLANPTVSKRHAELVWSEGELRFRDLGSTNGTFLNGRRISNLELIRDGDRLQFGTAMFTARRSGQTQIWATVSENVAEVANACMQFDRLLSEPAVVPHFQPIVRFGDGQRIGYEILARSRLSGLESPTQMFHIAEELGMEQELSSLMRREGLRTGKALGLGGKFYVNTHPTELRSPALLDSLKELREQHPELGIVLEVHEAAVTSVDVLGDLRSRCDGLGIELAYDDFGAGQSRLVELAEAPPHVIKFDMHMIRGIARFPLERRQMIKSLVEMVRSLDVVPLAEGIETADEATACQEVGFELAQGYYFGRPSPARAWVAPPLGDTA